MIFNVVFLPENHAVVYPDSSAGHPCCVSVPLQRLLSDERGGCRDILQLLVCPKTHFVFTQKKLQRSRFSVIKKKTEYKAESNELNTLEMFCFGLFRVFVDQ